MKKASKLQTKAAPAKKANLKAGVKKAASTVSPKLSSNHNETLLTRLLQDFLENADTERHHMKKASKLQTKAVPAKKANLKVGVKKAASTVSPKLAGNHNETLLTR
jgi:hypothetical protein